MRDFIDILCDSYHTDEGETALVPESIKEFHIQGEAPKSRRTFLNKPQGSITSSTKEKALLLI